MLDGFILEMEDDRLPPAARQLVEGIRCQIDVLATRMGPGTALIHGDAHFGNALYNEGGATLLDWATARVGNPESDLCHALGMNLPSYAAREYELPMLQHYADTRAALGSGVEFEQLVEHYRLCLLSSVVISIALRAIVAPFDWSYLFTNAVDAALQHDSLDLIA